MAKYATTSIWTDEFNKPTVDGLRKLVILDAKKAFDKARTKIHSLGEYENEVQWFGDCWFWTVSFVSDNLDEPLAIIIPSPEDLQIATPLTHEFIDQLSTRRLKRFVRDGLELAMEPHKTNWAIWSVPTPAAVEDVMPVIKSKHKFYSE
ncbi:MAG: hypothetical protein QF718_09985 [Phycisphaerales bacterium]|jgi:hypothetical protein|nr:hypothetical protein [Phycisphaerales bacterium]